CVVASTRSGLKVLMLWRTSVARHSEVFSRQPRSTASSLSFSLTTVDVATPDPQTTSTRVSLFDMRCPFTILESSTFSSHLTRSLSGIDRMPGADAVVGADDLLPAPPHGGEGGHEHRHDDVRQAPHAEHHQHLEP